MSQATRTINSAPSTIPSSHVDSLGGATYRLWVSVWEPLWLQSWHTQIVAVAVTGSRAGLYVPVRENLPITIVHISNGGFSGYGPGFWGEGHDPYTYKVMGSNEVNMPRAIAEFGYHTERIDEPDQVTSALERALSANDSGRSAYLEFIFSQFPVYGVWAR